MGRPFYPHEADDPDLDWLVSNFLYERPDYQPIESGMLPLVLIPYHDESYIEEERYLEELSKLNYKEQDNKNST